VKAKSLGCANGSSKLAPNLGNSTVKRQKALQIALKRASVEVVRRLTAL
jgi:hypothetical protein